MRNITVPRVLITAIGLMFGAIISCLLGVITGEIAYYECIYTGCFAICLITS